MVQLLVLLRLVPFIVHRRGTRGTLKAGNRLLMNRLMILRCRRLRLTGGVVRLKVSRVRVILCRGRPTCRLTPSLCRRVGMRRVFICTYLPMR